MGVQTTTILPAETRRAAEQLAAADGRSLSDFVARAVAAAVARRTPRRREADHGATAA
jgi:hypothetical protein